MNDLKNGAALVMWWCQETLTRWILPEDVWKPLEADLERIHEKFMGEELTPDEEASLDKVFVLLYGEEETAPFDQYKMSGSQTQTDAIIARIFLTGTDPC
jgi:hypothetical protein